MVIKPSGIGSESVYAEMVTQRLQSSHKRADMTGTKRHTW